MFKWILAAGAIVWLGGVIIQLIAGQELLSPPVLSRMALSLVFFVAFELELVKEKLGQ